MDEFLGQPAQVHSTGTPGAMAALERLESMIDSLGHTTQRIETTWPDDAITWYDTHRSAWVPDLWADGQAHRLVNLLVSVQGSEADLAPLWVASHHDSCRFGPGAGDAAMPCMAMVEMLRVLAQSPPRRTVHFWFTDGEEYGLLGAKSIARLDPLPTARPAFVINMDARGNRGPAVMFETGPNNGIRTREALDGLAFPQVTSSLAVTVYRMLPNATDFDVWNGEMGIPGFNFALIGGANHYHQPSDTPERVSDRTLQHYGNHLHSLIELLDAPESDTWLEMESKQAQPDTVFFDVLGLGVVCGSERTFWIGSGVSIFLCVLPILKWNRRTRSRSAGVLRIVYRWSCFGMSVMSAIVFGLAFQWVLSWAPQASQKYSPYDQELGLLSFLAGLLLSMLVARSLSAKLLHGHGTLM
ncbi:MAG: M28 family peptidase, partial [Planctomycetota bacterium]